jgi:hypothetical protein
MNTRFSLGVRGVGVVQANFIIEYCPLYSGTLRQGSKLSRIAAVSANDSHLHNHHYHVCM